MRGAIICSAHAGVHSIPFIEREQAGGREREAAAAACTSSQIISQGGMREWSLGRLVGPAASLALRRTDHVMQSVPQPAASALSSSVRPGDSNFIHGIFRRHAKIGGNPAADALHSLPAGRALALGSCLELRSSLARCAPTSSLFLARRARSLLSHPHTHTHVTPPFLFSALVSLTDCHWSKARDYFATHVAAAKIETSPDSSCSFGSVLGGAESNKRVSLSLVPLIPAAGANR